MVRFIRQEAEEKANEISISAEEEFNIERLQLLESAKRKLRQDYDRKLKQYLQAQDDVVTAMKDSAAKDLLRVSNDKNNYKKLLKSLIIESLLRLKEPSVLLRCREMDKKVVESVIEDAKRQYAEKAKVGSPKITIDEKVFLPPPPNPKLPDSHDPHCSGGVVLASQDGKIVCENTLDARLDVAFRQKLPQIRTRLVGAPETSRA
ncbi:unnamed protein product [Arabidopsis thaliana]|uniref:(thale cress) hypothetical protein n=1 Tax=Arabidopsis thaliana TaxID=3702 RepID=A0A7G2ENB5_ARATH|nr:unnamed protein product [Arabidopsis thaliana]